MGYVNQTQNPSRAYSATTSMSFFRWENYRSPNQIPNSPFHLFPPVGHITPRLLQMTQKHATQSSDAVSDIQSKARVAVLDCESGAKSLIGSKQERGKEV